jgi:beta-phosphoglucomutase-like phosphatase (HAD superfamily)
VIEDSDLGILAALRAGMRCIAVPNTLPPERLGGAGLVVRTLEDAAAVLRFLGEGPMVR